MRIILITVLIFFTSFVQAKKQSSSQSKGDGFTAYAALGENLRPFSFRLGYANWEVGQLNGLYGFNKIFHLDDRYYSGFGFALTTTVGFYGAVGIKAKLWFIPIRCELAAIMDAKALTQSGALIGVTYGF